MMSSRYEMVAGEALASEQPLPNTSLIICSRNRPQLLVDLVHSILRGDALPTEIIVIDDSDVENQVVGTLRSEQPTTIRYIWNRSVGLSRANNTGVLLARYELLVFTQDDIVVEPDWFGNIVRALVNAGQDVVVTGRILPGETEVEGGFAPSTISEEEACYYEGRIGKDVLFMQNAALYKSTGEVIGWFDPSLGPGTPFPTAEDNDFGYRLLEAGFHILYEPRAMTHHRAWRGTEDIIETSWNYGRGQGAYLSKHASLQDPYMLGRLLRDSLYMTVRSVIRLFYRPKASIRDIVYLGGLISAAVQWRMR